MVPVLFPFLSILPYFYFSVLFLYNFFSFLSILSKFSSISSVFFIISASFSTVMLLWWRSRRGKNCRKTFLPFFSSSSPVPIHVYLLCRLFLSHGSCPLFPLLSSTFYLIDVSCSGVVVTVLILPYIYFPRFLFSFCFSIFIFSATWY